MKLQKFLAAKCSQRLLMAVNLIACALMLISIALRFYYLAVYKDGQSRAIFFVVLAIYQVMMITFLILAEFKNIRVRLYFDIMDSKWGRASLILFIQLLIFESRSRAIIVILGIVVLFIAVAGLILGWNEGPDGTNTSLDHLKYGGAA